MVSSRIEKKRFAKIPHFAQIFFVSLQNLHLKKCTNFRILCFVSRQKICKFREINDLIPRKNAQILHEKSEGKMFKLRVKIDANSE